MTDLYSIFKQCGSVATDSRAIKGGELFFALKGENFDGNEYALKALESGALWAVVNEGTPAAESGNPAVIAVPDTLAALQKLAREHREKTLVNGKRLTVIGLTGTNGKTTTKELIKAVLSKKYKVTATEGNLNNDIGVPLSILKINQETQIAVIEMGASHPDDISKLVEVSAPDYGLITNVGKAHLLGFGSFEGVKKAKGALYDYICVHGGRVFLNSDDHELSSMADARGIQTPITYGVRTWDAMVLPSDSAHPYLRMAIPETPGNDYMPVLETHLVGAYNASNVLAAMAVGLHFGVEFFDAADAVADYIPSNNRSQMVKTDRNSLIVDAYNANPTSMNAALDNFANIADEAKTVMLGSMGELGDDSLKEHIAVVKRLSEVPCAYLVGGEFKRALEQTGTPDNVKWFENSEALAGYLKENPVIGQTVLVKGSRSAKMERVLEAL